MPIFSALDHTHYAQAIKIRTMSVLDAWLDDQLITLYEPVSETPLRLSSKRVDQSNEHPLDKALDIVILAVAALHRAGPYFAQRSETFWYFAAGTLPRALYDMKVKEALGELPKRTSVDCDVDFAGRKVREAVKVLRREGYEKDARDLEEAAEGFADGV